MELWIFIVAIYLIYILFFKKKKTKSAGSYTSAPVKAPPKEWLANNKKNQSVMQNEDSEDDNLATFTLSGGRNVEYSITALNARISQKRPVLWLVGFFRER